MSERWKARRDPQVRQARKAQRRRELNEALSDADGYARRHGPTYTEIYTRGLTNTKR